MLHHASARALPGFDHGVVHARHRDIFEGPIEELSIKRLCLVKVGGVEFYVNKRICHHFLLESSYLRALSLEAEKTGGLSQESWRAGPGNRSNRGCASPVP